MGVRDCAQIDTSGPNDFVYNMIVVDEADFDFFQANWLTWFTNQRIQWASELVAAPGYIEPVWINWVRNPDDTWYDPSVEPIDPEEN